MPEDTASLRELEPIGVLGLGVEGRATIDYLLARGVERVTALDAQPIAGLPSAVEAVFGAGHADDLGRFATVFRSPGIRPDLPALDRARADGTRVTSALDHFIERCPCPIVGVTGTAGKGTCCSLTAALLAAAGRVVHLGGNIGLSPLSFLAEVRADHAVVLEISSFQAMDLGGSPEIGVVLKTTSEHLDWHRDTAEYRAAKARMLAHQSAHDAVIFNADSAGAVAIARTSAGRKLAFSLEGEVDAGLFLRDGRFCLRLAGAEQELAVAVDRVRLPGRFNLENVAAALLAAIVAGADPGALGPAAEAFEGLPHRIELVAERHGVRYYNDSYATRPDATIAALSAFDGAPLALILGGSEKHADFAELVEALRASTDLRHVSLIGGTAERLAAEIARWSPVRFTVSQEPDLEGAVAAAVAALDAGGVVLLSPACASFGLFPNYKVRGERFREIARRFAGDRSAS